MLNKGTKLQIQCYKHDGSIHRAWDEAVVLDVKKDYIVFGNNKTLVTEAEGNKWKTKEPAVMYFFKDKWFNIIAQLKNTYNQRKNNIEKKYQEGKIQTCVKVEHDTVYFNMMKLLNKLEAIINE